MFISFEGIDGSGKSTQCHRLAEYLRAKGFEVVLTREPGGSPGAEAIRALVLTGDPDRWSPETEILLFTAARRDHVEKTIRPALGAGKIVISDRFADSTRIYQGATRGDLRHTVDQLHDLMIGIEPDLTFILDMDAKVGLSRSLARLAAPETGGAEGAVQTAHIGTQTALAASQANALSAAVEMIADGTMPEDRFETFGPLFQETLRRGFLEIASTFADRCILIDGNRDAADVAAEIATCAMSRIAR